MADTSSLVPAELLDQLFTMGGPVMMVLIALAVTGTIAFLYLMLFGCLFAPRLTRPLKATIADWQQGSGSVHPDQLRQQAGPYARLNPMLHLVANTIEACQKRHDSSQIRESAVHDAQQALEPFEAPLKIIEVIAALAPLLGLLGTVMGMMDAFSAMAATEGRANAAQLSGGIYTALSTTAAGLVVAIPFAALAAWIEFRLRRIHKTMNSTLVAVLNPAAAGTPAVAQEAPASLPEQPAPEAQARAKDKIRHSTVHDDQGLAHAAG